MLNSHRPFGAMHSGHTHLFSIVQDFTCSIEPICNCQNSSVPGGKPTRIYQADMPVYRYCAQFPYYLVSGWKS